MVAGGAAACTGCLAHLGGVRERSEHWRSLPLSIPGHLPAQKGPGLAHGKRQRDVPCAACAGDIQVPLPGRGDGSAELWGGKPSCSWCLPPGPGLGESPGQPLLGRRRGCAAELQPWLVARGPALEAQVN